MTCPWSWHDGAYLLGALAPEERHAYEEHLAGCAACTAALGEIAGLPGLLSRLPAEAAERVEPPPADLLPALLSAVAAERRTRRRRHRLIAAGSALAAAAAAVAVLLLAPARAPAPAPAPVAMSRVIDVPITASASLVDKPWGTEIRLRCSYTGSVEQAPPTYLLVVTDRAGRAEQVSTWRTVAGRPTVLTAATSLRRPDLSLVEVRAPSGQPVLRLRA